MNLNSPIHAALDLCRRAHDSIDATEPRDAYERFWAGRVEHYAATATIWANVASLDGDDVQAVEQASRWSREVRDALAMLIFSRETDMDAMLRCAAHRSYHPAVARLRRLAETNTLARQLLDTINTVDRQLEAERVAQRHAALRPRTPPRARRRERRCGPRHGHARVRQTRGPPEDDDPAGPTRRLVGRRCA